MKQNWERQKKHGNDGEEEGVEYKVKRISNNRSSHPEGFCIKGVLRNFAKFTGKHLCQSLFFNKLY